MQTYYTFNRATRRPTGEIQSLHKPQCASDVPPPDAMEGHYVAYDILGKSWVQIPIPVPTPKSLDELKQDKISEIDRKTETNLDTHGVTVDFDFGSGVETYTFSGSKSAKMNWTLLLNLARDCMDNKVVEADYFPRPVQLFPDESLVQLNTAILAFQFCYTVLGAIETYRADRANIKAQVAAATTVAEVEAITIE